MARLRIAVGTAFQSTALAQIGAGLLLVTCCAGDATAEKREVRWSGDTVSSAVATQNRRGRQVSYARMPNEPLNGVSRQALESTPDAALRSGYEDDGGAVSGNFTLAIPLLRLRGRGQDLDLRLYYHSLVWSRIADEPVFDADADWPAPGWSLGFGKLTPALLIEADGTRHGLLRIDATHSRTTDGSFIEIEWLPPAPTGVSARAAYPDGRLVEFSGERVRYPTRLVDRNGNTVDVTYRAPNEPMIASITDTVGRRIGFLYDGDERLIGFTQPGLSGNPLTICRFHYVHVVQAVRIDRAPASIDEWLIDALYFPTTGAGYWFGDTFVPGSNVTPSYSNFGMLRKVVRQTGMSIQGQADTSQGTVIQGRTINTRVYLYSDLATTTPRITSMTETWLGGTAPAVTTFSTRFDRSTREVTITYPDGSQHVQVANEAPGRPDTGLVSFSTLKSPDGRALATEITQWEVGADGAPRVRRVERQNERGLTVKREYTYGPRDEVTDERLYGFDGSLVRRTATQYVTAPSYLQRRFFRLISRIQVFAGTAATPSLRVDYGYDERDPMPAPGVVQHAAEFDPFLLPAGRNTVRARGNRTSVTTYGVAATASQPFVLRMDYDVTGNLVARSRWPGEETRFDYTAATQFAFPSIVTAGASDPMSPLRMTERFDFNLPAGVMLSHLDVNNVTTTWHYEETTLALDRVRNGAQTIVTLSLYDGGLQTVRELQDAAGTVLLHAAEQRDGRGRLVRTERATASGNTDVQDLQYTTAGQLAAASLPYRRGAADVRWATYAYDALGRVVSRTSPDGSVERRFYDEAARPASAGAGAGATTRIVDAWGRERWYLNDALGGLVRVVRPTPQNTQGVLRGAGTATAYAYDILGNLVRVDHDGQRREFAYDSLSRQLRERVPEKVASLSVAGRYMGSAIGEWSEVRTYDDRTGNLATVTDARGIRTLVGYANDPLGRMQTVRYVDERRVIDRDDSRPIPLPADSAVEPAAGIDYRYVTAGDLTRIQSVITADIGSESFTYDAFGRLESVTSRLAVVAPLVDVGTPAVVRPGPPILVPAGGGVAIEPDPTPMFSTRYAYDTVGRLDTITEQFRVRGVAAPTHPSDVLTYSYAPDGRVGALMLGSGWRLDNLARTPSGQVTRRTYGRAADDRTGVFGVEETFDFDANSLRQRTHRVSRLDTGTALSETSMEYVRRRLTRAPGAVTDDAATGQMTRQLDALRQEGNVELDYDVLGRLSQARLGVTTDALGRSSFESLQEYAYDQFGNRTGVTAFSTPAPIVCPRPPCRSTGAILPPDRHDGWPRLSIDTATNHIVSPGFVYDEAGNVTAAPRPNGEVHQYRYDRAGRLVSVRDRTGQTIERYVYGADRRRLASVDGAGKWTLYHWRGAGVTAEYALLPQQTVTWERSYVRDAQGALLASFSADPTGGTRADFYVNGPATVQLALRIDPVAAAIVPSSAVGRPFGNDAPGRALVGERYFNYQRSAATGLDYAANRYYDSAQGRFLQPDPTGLAAAARGNPQSLNLYAYVSNDPVNATDALALRPKNTLECGMLPGDTWVLGGCVSTASDPGQPRDYSPSGTGWDEPRFADLIAADMKAGDRAFVEVAEFRGAVASDEVESEDESAVTEGSEHGSFCLIFCEGEPITTWDWVKKFIPEMFFEMAETVAHSRVVGLAGVLINGTWDLAEGTEHVLNHRARIFRGALFTDDPYCTETAGCVSGSER